MKRTFRIKQPSRSTQPLTPAEKSQLSSMWKRVERKWNVKIEDVSAEMTLCDQIVKEVTFKGKPDSKPLHIRLDWDSVVYAEDGSVLSEFEIDKKIAEYVDQMLEFIDSEEAI